MLIPSRLLLWLLAALLIAAGAAAIWPKFALVWRAGAALLLLLALGDAMYVLRPWRLAAQRRVPGSLPLGVWHDVTLRIANGEPHRIELTLFDHHPDGFEVRGLPRTWR